MKTADKLRELTKVFQTTNDAKDLVKCIYKGVETVYVAKVSKNGMVATCFDLNYENNSRFVFVSDLIIDN